MDKEEIDTPALIIDLDLLEKNIAKMARYFEGRPANVRPHIKTHKTPIIAHKQIEAGAEGITCAKVGEAEVMVAAGIRSILIANEIVGRQKIERLINLTRHSEMIVAVDDPGNVEELSNIAQENDAELNVLVDVNLSQFGRLEGILDRCGVLPGKPALSLAKKVRESKGLRLRGLMGYEGGMGRFIEFEKRKEACHRALKSLIETRSMLEDAGIDVEIVSSGGTSTYRITGDYPGVTEVQAGAYATMDTQEGGMEGVDFDYALTLLTTVISRPYPEKALLDCGLKSITRDMGWPGFKDLEGVELIALNEEHGHLRLKNPSRELRVGDKIELIPSHGCTTINQHDKFYAVRRGKVEAVWEIMGRGRFQ